MKADEWPAHSPTHPSCPLHARLCPQAFPQVCSATAASSLILPSGHQELTDPQGTVMPAPGWTIPVPERQVYGGQQSLLLPQQVSFPKLWPPWSPRMAAVIASPSEKDPNSSGAGKAMSSIAPITSLGADLPSTVLPMDAVAVPFFLSHVPFLSFSSSFLEPYSICGYFSLPCLLPPPTSPPSSSFSFQPTATTPLPSATQVAHSPSTSSPLPQACVPCPQNVVGEENTRQQRAADERSVTGARKKAERVVCS